MCGATNKSVIDGFMVNEVCELASMAACVGIAKCQHWGEYLGKKADYIKELKDSEKFRRLGVKVESTVTAVVNEVISQTKKVLVDSEVAAQGPEVDMRVEVEELEDFRKGAVSVWRVKPYVCLQLDVNSDEVSNVTIELECDNNDYILRLSGEMRHYSLAHITGDSMPFSMATVVYRTVYGGAVYAVDLSRRQIKDIHIEDTLSSAIAALWCSGV